MDDGLPTSLYQTKQPPGAFGGSVASNSQNLGLPSTRAGEICKDFNNKGGHCPRGANCPFLHIYESENARRRANAQKSSEVRNLIRQVRQSLVRKLTITLRKICKDFNNYNGHCPRGENCPFQHVKEEVPYDFKRAASTRPCRHWMRDGSCPRGDTCAFLHENPQSSSFDVSSSSASVPCAPRTTTAAPTKEGTGEEKVRDPHTEVLSGSDSMTEKAQESDVVPAREGVRLTKELAELLGANKELMQINTQKREENTKLKREIVELRKGNLTLRKENLMLRKNQGHTTGHQSHRKRKREKDKDTHEEGERDEGSSEEGIHDGNGNGNVHRETKGSAALTTRSRKKRKEKSRSPDNGDSDFIEE